MEIGPNEDSSGTKFWLDPNLPIKRVYLELAKKAWENRAKLGDATKKTETGSSSDQDSSTKRNIGLWSDLPIYLLDANNKMERGSSSDQDNNNNRNFRSWSDLPIDLLDLIIKRLGAIELQIFACVCKSWRSFAVDAEKKGFMENQPPLILCISKPVNVSSTCHFYNLPYGDDHKSVVTYKRRLPSNAVGKTCVGFSCGYLFMQDEENYKDSQLLLVNPFTGHEFHFPSPRNRYCQYILATCIKPYPQFVVIAFSAKFPYLQFRRCGDDSWTIVNTPSQFHWIEDVAVYEGKAYVLTRDARIGVLNLDSRPHLRMLMLQGYAILASPLRNPGRLHLIAASDRQQLFVVDCTSAAAQKIYRLDFLSEQWIKVNSIGDQALFFGGSIKNSSILSPPTKMIKRYMDVDICRDCCYELKHAGRFHGGFSVIEKGIGASCRSSRDSSPRPLFPEYLYLWCFPSLACNVDSIF